MSTTETATTNKVKLFARCEAAIWDNETGDVTLNERVEPKWIVSELIREIQTLQKENADLKKKLEDLSKEPVVVSPEEKL